MLPGYGNVTENCNHYTIFQLKINMITVIDHVYGKHHDYISLFFLAKYQIYLMTTRRIW